MVSFAIAGQWADMTKDVTNIILEVFKLSRFKTHTHTHTFLFKIISLSSKFYWLMSNTVYILYFKTLKKNTYRLENGGGGISL